LRESGSLKKSGKVKRGSPANPCVCKKKEYDYFCMNNNKK
jgi:ribosomal protein S30